MICKQIRDFIKAEALSCLSPIETGQGYLVNKLVTYRGFEISMKYLQEKEDLWLYYDSKSEVYKLFKGRREVWHDNCPPVVSDIIKSCNKATKLLIIHSAFCFMMREGRRAAHVAAHVAAAAAAHVAAYGVAAAAADAAHAAAADAARAAHDADAARRKAFRLMMKWRSEK